MDMEEGLLECGGEGGQQSVSSSSFFFLSNHIPSNHLHCNRPMLDRDI